MYKDYKHTKEENRKNIIVVVNTISKKKKKTVIFSYSDYFCVYILGRKCSVIYRMMQVTTGYLVYT